MCAISGWFGFNVSIEKYLQSHKRLSHRGLDDEGFVVLQQDSKIEQYAGDNTHGSFLLPQLKSLSGRDVNGVIGHHRLSIHDLSPRGHQPMCDPSGRVWVIHNGEIYNYKELRDELFKDYCFKSDSDSEVVLAAYLKYGNNCWSRFNGMWSIAIFDARENKLILSRDRFGVKPLYYSQRNYAILFASEVKFFKDLIPYKLNHNAAFEYLSAVLIDNRTETLIQGIKEVQPAELIEVDLNTNKIRNKKYWDLEFGGKNYHNASLSEAIEEFNRIFDSAVELRLDSDVAVGALLSGGLDSTSIVCNVASKQIGKVSDFQTFSVSYHDESISERKYIEDTLKVYPSINAKFLTASAESLKANLVKTIYTQDLPIRGLNVVCWYELYQMIQRESEVKVTYSGQGADEIFGGYTWHFHYNLLDMMLSGKETENEIQYVCNYNNSKRTSLDRKLASIKRNFPTRHSEFVNNPIFLQNSIEAIPTYSDDNPLRDVLCKNLFFSPLREFLRYEDRNSMAANIESRAPFMDYRLIEFGMNLPNDLKIKDGIRKYIVRKATESYNCKKVLRRTDKQGFDSPQRIWQRTELKPFLDEMISNLELSFIDKDAMMKNYNAYQAMESHDWVTWGRLAAFQQWYELYFSS